MAPISQLFISTPMIIAGTLIVITAALIEKRRADRVRLADPFLRTYPGKRAAGNSSLLLRIGTLALTGIVASLWGGDALFFLFPNGLFQ